MGGVSDQGVIGRDATRVERVDGRGMPQQTIHGERDERVGGPILGRLIQAGCLVGQPGARIRILPARARSRQQAQQQQARGKRHPAAKG